MEADPQTVFDFALLFRGGKVAIDDPDDDRGFRPWQTDDGGFIPADGKDWISVVDDHLNTGPSIGVYPLFTQNDQHMVYWGCVDWDDPPPLSLTHAKNVWEALRQLGVTSWVEQSRSKGFHLWVFFKDTMPAVSVREGLIGVCNIVDAPAKEVNPKQVELSERGWGNGVRLPYGFLRKPGGYNEVVQPDVTYSKRPVGSFVVQAIANVTPVEDWEAVRAVYSPPDALPAPQQGVGTREGVLTGLAASIRDGGPRTSPDKPHGDRSATLYALACAMVRQGYSDHTVLREMEAADIDWGAKYFNRPDGGRQLERTLQNAKRHAWEDK